MWTFLTGVLFVAGAVGVVFVFVKRFHITGHQDETPLCLVLVVSHAERTIEGMLRTLLWKSSRMRRDRKIIVINEGPSDETRAIVTQLARDQEGIEYRQVMSDEELGAELQRACLECSRMGMVYDLRSAATMRELTYDLTRLYE